MYTFIRFWTKVRVNQLHHVLTWGRDGKGLTSACGTPRPSDVSGPGSYVPRIRSEQSLGQLKHREYGNRIVNSSEARSFTILIALAQLRSVASAAMTAEGG